MSSNSLQPLSSVLKSLSENFSFEKLSNSRQAPSYFSLFNSLESMKDLLPSNDFLEILRSKSRCSYCLLNEISIFSECGHGFCTDCIENIQNTLACPVCEKYFVPTKGLQGFKQCASCDSYLQNDMFYNDSLCHPHCKLCISLNLASGNISCAVCLKKLQLNPETCYECLECGKKLNFMNSNYLCRVHSFCIQCFCEGLQEKKCLKCCKSIEICIESDSKLVANPKCGRCGINKHASLFVFKSCCAYKNCIACQLKFGMVKCLGCQKKLNQSNFLNV